MNEAFIKLGVTESFAGALEKAGIVEPTPIQSRVIPLLLSGKNVIGQSATGTGKTLAYVLPVLQEIDATLPTVQAIVAAPTFELAMQIFRQTKALSDEAPVPIRAASAIGGVKIERQIDQLKKKPHVVVGSAGRIVELIRKGKLKPDKVKTLVLDEADRMLDDQNASLTDTLVRAMPRECRHILVSATIGARALKRAAFVQNPEVVRLDNRPVCAPEIEHIYFLAEFRDKAETLRKLTHLLPIERGIVFVNRADDVADVLAKLRYHGFAAVQLTSGDKLERQKALADFSGGRARLLVSTDLAARGLDIPAVDYVVHYGLPEDETVYLHRAGRTGRAGNRGCVVTLSAPQETVRFDEIVRKAGVTPIAKRMSGGRILDFVHRCGANVHDRFVRRDASRRQKPKDGARGKKE